MYHNDVRSAFWEDYGVVSTVSKRGTGTADANGRNGSERNSKNRDDKNHHGKGADDSLVAIWTFVANCEKRRVFQRKLRRDMQIGVNDDWNDVDVDESESGGGSGDTLRRTMGEVDQYDGIEQPTRVPDNIMEEEERFGFGGADWASIEDFEEHQIVSGDDGVDDFWDDQ